MRVIAAMSAGRTVRIETGDISAGGQANRRRSLSAPPPAVAPMRACLLVERDEFRFGIAVDAISVRSREGGNPGPRIQPKTGSPLPRDERNERRCKLNSLALGGRASA